jgi:hypothetical protein
MKRWALPIILLLLMVGLIAWKFFSSDATKGATLVRQMATEGLAKEIIRFSPRAKVLVVSNPFTTQPNISRSVLQGEQAGLRGLQKVLGKEALTVAFPQLKNGALENPTSFSMPHSTTTPIAYLLSDDAFDAVWEKNTKCDFIVSLIGIPPDIRQHHLWQRADGPKLVFLLPDLWILGDKSAIAEAFKSGKIAAAVMNKPEAPSDQVLDPKLDFSKRFLLITAANVDDMIAKYPLLFESPE